MDTPKKSNFSAMEGPPCWNFKFKNMDIKNILVPWRGFLHGKIPEKSFEDKYRGKLFSEFKNMDI